MTHDRLDQLIKMQSRIMHFYDYSNIFKQGFIYGAVKHRINLWGDNELSEQLLSMMQDELKAMDERFYDLCKKWAEKVEKEFDAL